MLSRLRHIAILILLLVGCALQGVAASAPTWEEVSSPHPAVSRTLDMEGETEIIVSDGYIYIWSQKAVTVKIFSILGQLISKESIKPGLHRIKLNARGIFILRAGTTTRRITL